MGDKDPLRPGRPDRRDQPRPVGMVRQGERRLHPAPPRAQRHPARNDPDRDPPQPQNPIARQHIRRRDDQRVMWHRARDPQGRRQAMALRPQNRRHSLHRVMAMDRPLRRHSGHQALRLAKGIGRQHRHHAPRRIARPPSGNRGQHLPFRTPLKYRQRKGAFGDERVAADRFEGFTEPVGHNLVIARDDPDFAAPRHPDLSRARHMACRMKRHRNAADLPRLAIGDPLGTDPPQPVADHRQSSTRAQIGPVPPPRMIGMAMGDQGPFHRMARVDVKIPRRAVDALLGKGQKRVAGHIPPSFLQ